jgi:hypothetical protein
VTRFAPVDRFEREPLPPDPAAERVAVDRMRSQLANVSGDGWVLTLELPDGGPRDRSIRIEANGPLSLLALGSPQQGVAARREQEGRAWHIMQPAGAVGFRTSLRGRGAGEGLRVRSTGGALALRRGGELIPLSDDGVPLSPEDPVQQAPAEVSEGVAAVWFDADRTLPDLRPSPRPESELARPADPE